MSEPEPATHTICLIEGLTYADGILAAVERQLLTQHSVHLIDCYNKKGVLMALHKDDVGKSETFYWENQEYVFAPFNLRWADSTTRLIFRRWITIE